MERTLDVLRFWNSSRISQVLRVRPDRVQEQADLPTLFGMFSEIGELLKERRNEFANYANLVALVEQKQQETVRSIYRNAVNSIIDYAEDQQLQVKIQQYEYVLEHQLLAESGCSPQLAPWQEAIFSDKVLPQLIETNIIDLHQTAQVQSNMPPNQDSTDDECFLSFYRALFALFGQYFSSWHKVTTFHIQHGKYKDSFIAYRTVVFQKMLERIEQSLKYSSRTNSLPLPRLLTLARMAGEFLESGR
jgi:hypothetical protein